MLSGIDTVVIVSLQTSDLQFSFEVIDSLDDLIVLGLLVCIVSAKGRRVYPFIATHVLQFVFFSKLLLLF